MVMDDKYAPVEVSSSQGVCVCECSAKICFYFVPAKTVLEFVSKVAC